MLQQKPDSVEQIFWKSIKCFFKKFAQQNLVFVGAFSLFSGLGNSLRRFNSVKLKLSFLSQSKNFVVLFKLVVVCSKYLN